MRELIRADSSLRDHGILGQAPEAGFSFGVDPTGANPDGLADVASAHGGHGGQANLDPELTESSGRFALCAQIG